MKINIYFLLFLASFLMGVSVRGPAAASTLDVPDDVVFVVNAENAVSEISAREISDFYFKRKRQWSNGESVRFIDRAASSTIRDHFLKKILKKSNSEVESFWIGQKLYSGDSAPLRENSDNATLQFVSTFKGAIGYVSVDTALDDKNVKAIKVSNKED